MIKYKLNLCYLLVAIVIALFNLEAKGQSKIVFRYNSDYSTNSDLQSDVSIKAVSVTEMIDAEEEVARGDDGWGFLRKKTSFFFRDTSRIQSKNSVIVSQTNQVNLSGDIWFKPVRENGALFLWQDSSSIHGIKLHLLNGAVVFKTKLYSQEFLYKSDKTLKLNRWHFIHWTVQTINVTIKVSVYLDGEILVRQENSIASQPAIFILNAPVTLGFDDISPQVRDSFFGEIYAVNVRNYIPQTEYQPSYLPFDGGIYSGMPNYLDFAVNSTEANLDNRISHSKTAIKTRIFVPYMNEDFIPQGITNSFEDENYSDTDGMIFMSMYNKTVTGQTRLKRSIVVEFNPSEKFAVRRCFRLRGVQENSHVGGIAYYNEKIYVASAKKIEIYSLPPYSGNREEKYQDLYPKSQGVFSVASDASFVTYHDDTLWVGDYRTTNEAVPHLYGYPLDEQGNVVNSVAPKKYQLPYRAQGAAWRKYANRKFLFVSVSGGNSESKVYRFTSTGLFSNRSPALDAVYFTPAGAEDVSFDKDGNLITASESGAKYFQKRASSPWKSFYPFVHIISAEVLFGDIPTSVFQDRFENREKNGNLTFHVYPNPFNSEVTLRYYLTEKTVVEISVFNSIGKVVKQLFWGLQDSGHHQLQWNAANFPSGIYFVKIVAEAEQKSRKLLLIK